MAYINKIVVNGQEVNANQLEGILDKDGHARFIEGEITTPTITGVEFTYKKWSLSGTHLMLVLAGNLTAANISQGTKIGEVTLPTWINNKIYTLISASQIVTINKMTARLTGGTPIVEYACELGKNDTNIEIYNSVEINPSLYNGGFRLQFDLLIDNE